MTRPRDAALHPHLVDDVLAVHPEGLHHIGRHTQRHPHLHLVDDAAVGSGRWCSRSEHLIASPAPLVAITTFTAQHYLVVAASGEVDVATAGHLRRSLLDAIRQGQHHLIMDLSGVTFLECTGLGVLVATRRRVRAHCGSFSLVITQDRVLNLLRKTGLESVFTIHHSLRDALPTGST